MFLTRKPSNSRSQSDIILVNILVFFIKFSVNTKYLYYYFCNSSLHVINENILFNQADLTLQT